jgi:pimeloyl-ACP methyl ester carboxylesterase
MTINPIVYRTQVGEHTILTRACLAAPPGRPSLVLVHGHVASSRYMLPALRAFAPHCRVHAPDLPGWGGSSKPAQALSLRELAAVLGAWADEIGLDRPIFLGNSLGCQILAELAVQRPALPAGLVLLGPTVDPTVRTLLSQALRLAADLPRERPSLWLVELADLMRMGPRRFVQIVRVMLDDCIEVKLPRITVPTLVVRGSRDPIAPQRWAEDAARLLPHGRLAVLPGAGHAANYSTPDRLVAAVLPFIRALTDPPDAGSPYPPGS